MSNFVGVGGVHDVGGVSLEDLENGGFIDVKDKKLQHWELSVHALLVILASRKPALMTTDELRRAVEALEPAIYNSWGYYERWGAAMTTIMLERGVFTQAQWDQYLSGDEYAVTEAQPVKFQVGDQVKIRRENSRIRWRRPHIRCPGYVFGVSGVISNIIGTFDDPFILAFRGKGPKQPLYTVIVKLRDLWAGGKYPTGDLQHSHHDHDHHHEQGDDDVIEIEVYQDWLELSVDEKVKEEAVHHHEHDHKHEHEHEHEHHHAHDSSDACCDHTNHSNISAHDIVEAGVIADMDQAAHAALDDHHHDHNHDHGHSHSHDHASTTTATATACKPALQVETTPGQVIAETLIRYLIELKVFTIEQVHQTIDRLEQAGQRLAGAKLVAMAWKDPAFRARLLADPAAAGLEIDVVTANPNAPTVLRVVANSVDTHHVIVCTLCSCYPAALLGLSPAWYKSRNYRARMVREPRTVLKDTFGVEIPANQRVMVHDSTADCRYLVLPMPPAALVASGGIETMTWQELLPYVTRDSMVGVAVL